MRSVLLFVALAACGSDDGIPTSAGTLSTNVGVAYARATYGSTFHGAPYSKWTIDLKEVDTCVYAPAASLEIDLLSSAALAPGPVPIRNTDEPASLPSALFNVGADPATTGMATITSIDTTQLTGTITATTSAGSVTSTFTALVCM